MKRGKRGLSTIVATLIVILLVFVAVGILWVVLRNFISGGAEQISLGELTLDLKIGKVQQIDDSNLSVMVKRNAGAGNFTGINFVIYDAEMDNSEVIKVDNVNMNELDERTFYLTLEEINASEISKIEIVPVFTLESGKESIGDVKDTIELNSQSPSQSNGSQQCTSECSASGSLQCSGNGYQTCGNYDADSCLEWNSVTACASGQTCSNGICSATCTNECSPSGQTECVLGTNYRTCGNYDADSCLEWSSTTDCAIDQVCSAGQCISGNNPPAYNNLVTWLRFEGNVEDEMNNNDADIFPVVASSVTYATGHEGQSVNLPAVSGNYVNLPITISGNQLSIAFWANADATNSNRGFFNYNYNNGYRGRISGGVPQVVVLGSAGTYSGTVIIPTSQWMHYVYTFDGSTGEVDVYINGVRDIDQTMSGGFSLSATYIQIGKSWTNTELFDGRIDEFMIYNKRLDQTEVSSLYSYAP